MGGSERRWMGKSVMGGSERCGMGAQRSDEKAAIREGQRWAGSAVDAPMAVAYVRQW
jgi:hypothetical protein